MTADSLPHSLRPATSWQRSGMSLIEVIVAISVVAALASLLMMGMQRVRANAAGVRCVANLKSIGVAAHIYAGQNNGRWPYFTYTMEPRFPYSAADTGGYETVSALRTERWNGLGKLYQQGHIDNAATFFCPADRPEAERRDHYNWQADTGWISGSYVLRGYRQFSWQYMVADGRNPLRVANLTTSAMVSCYFLRSPPVYDKVSYHATGYPVLFGDGSVATCPFPSQLMSAQNPPTVWGAQELQRQIWMAFDHARN